MTDIKTKLIPMIARIEVENSIEEFLKYWYDTEGEDAEPTQEDYEHYCFERAHSVSDGKNAYIIDLVEQKTK
jgi:hypothetical protein